MSSAIQPIGLTNSQKETLRVIVADDFVKNRPGSRKRTGPRKRPRTYRLASSPVTRPAGEGNFGTLKVGLTVWKLHAEPGPRSNAGQSLTESRPLQWIAKRVEADTRFHRGDFLRFSIESPRPGYLYVINRDLLTDGSFGETNLIFPTRGDDNRLQAGRLIDIPAVDQTPFKADPKSNQAGEMLTIIVTSAPLQLQISKDPLPISSVQLVEWEERWGGPTERFELDGGVGQARTRREQQAAAREATRQLTRDDPGPQTIYLLNPKNADGLLFNLMLSYR